MRTKTYPPAFAIRKQAGERSGKHGLGVTILFVFVLYYFCQYPAGTARAWF